MYGISIEFTVVGRDIVSIIFTSGATMRTHILASAIAVLSCAQSQAAPILFTGTDGHRAASALLDVSGNSLVITLTNTATHDLMFNTESLTAIFFSSSVPLSLTRTSVVLAAGSSVIRDTQPAGGVVGGEWAYKNLSGGTSHGVSSVGLDIFGPPDRFPGDNLDGPPNPNGPEYGITTINDDPSTGNGTAGEVPLIKNSVVITLGGLPDNFSVSSISNISVLYGTSLTNPSFALVPEPASLSALALGGLALARRRRA
jgi:hypothetical protein